MNDHKNLNDCHNYHKGNNDEIELIKEIVTGDVLQTIFVWVPLVTMIGSHLGFGELQWRYSLSL